MVVLLDTGFILALRNEDDTNFQHAQEIMRSRLIKKEYGRILVTDYVFDEVMTLILVRIKDKKFMRETKQFLLETKRVLSLRIPDEAFWKTVDLFSKYFDQGLSFTDCTFLSLADSFSFKTYIATFGRKLAKFVTNVVQ